VVASCVSVQEALRMRVTALSAAKLPKLRVTVATPGGGVQSAESAEGNRAAGVCSARGRGAEALAVRERSDLRPDDGCTHSI